MNRGEKGFTLVELLMAMAFFSFILLFITTGFIIVNRAYNKGITIKLVQDEGRRVLEGFSREIRTVGALSFDDTGTNNECFETSNSRYYWSVPIDDTNPESPTRLLKESNQACTDPIDMTNPGGEDMLHERVGVQFMKVETLNATGIPFYRIVMRLSTDSTDLIADDNLETAECSISPSDPYCSVVEFSTVVNAR